jgi:hypothetical protein
MTFGCYAVCGAVAMGAAKCMIGMQKFQGGSLSIVDPALP